MPNVGLVPEIYENNGFRALFHLLFIRRMIYRKLLYEGIVNDMARANAFLDLFTSFPDIRQPWKIRHVLHEIIFTCIAGSPCGCDDFERIEDFAHGRRKWLSKYLTLPNGIPSHDTMARAFQAPDKDSFILAFLEFTKAAEAQAGQGVIAIDGNFITSIDPNVEKFAYCVRNHWGIESMHWVLEPVFNEDKRRVRKDDAAENLAMATKFVYNLLSKDPMWKGKKKTKKCLRMICLMDEAELDRRMTAMFS